MIQAKELRIGNWVYSQMIDGPFQISNLTTDYDPLCKPIPLTEEILLKCGFNWSDGNKTHIEINMGEGRNLTFYFKDDKINETQLYDQMNQVYNGMYFFKPLLYLHQLQNLYFALTNTELEINL